MQTNTKKSIKSKLFPSVKSLVLAGLLSALSIVFGKLLAIPIGNVMRLSFENLPIIIAGITQGPIIGMLTGVVADIIGCILVGYEINPLVTVGAGIIGILSGGVYRFSGKANVKIKLILSVAASHTVGSVIIKTIGLAGFYSFPVFTLMAYRLLNYLIVGALEILLLYYLFKNQSIRGALGISEQEKKKENKMNINEALEYIHSVNWTFCKPGLERTRELCERLGNPQNNLKFIHVAGTNGKGSFCSMLSSVLVSQGYRVGLYTSPYIKCFNERMQINNRMISDEELIKITEKIKPIADSMADKPTEFELVTAIALEYFSSNSCDYVVFECGLGGRLDSTNIIETPLLTVITGIAYDHMSVLGNTIEEIAREKAGIIKEGIPCLWCGDNEDAYNVIFETAKEKNASLYTVDRSSVLIKNATLNGTFFDFSSYKDIETGLLGDYQITNATNVLTAIDIMKKQGVKIEESSIYDGLKNAKWSARFEIIKKDPIVIFDGGHNPQGVDSCVESVKRYFGNEGLIVVTGVMADKDYKYISERIGEIAKEVYCVAPNNPRALSAKEYAQVYNEMNIKAYGCESVEIALAKAIESAKQSGSGILCLGSLYMYSEISEAICQNSL